MPFSQNAERSRCAMPIQALYASAISVSEAAHHAPAPVEPQSVSAPVIACGGADRQSVTVHADATAGRAMEPVGANGSMVA